MKYKAEVDPRQLSTVTDPLRGYPEIWELLLWYRCWRKYPYPSEVIAALVVQDRRDDYHHYPCPLGGEHWHIGRGSGGKRVRDLIAGAKRRYRKSVRDEILADYERRQRVEEEASA